MSSYLCRHFTTKEHAGHNAHVSRFQRGRSPIGRGSPVYGTKVRCECGWKDHSNEAPTKGGIRDCQEAWKEHIRLLTAKEAAWPSCEPDNAL